jgi:CheY-like chemotaxis protein
LPSIDLLHGALRMPRILIADDEPLQRLLIRESLAGDVSFSFVEAENGRQALKQALVEKPDIVIIDVTMPQLDGFQVCRLFKDDPMLRRLPVILITARCRAEDGVNWPGAGAFTFIQKPFEVHELQEAVYSALKHVSGQAEVWS